LPYSTPTPTLPRGQLTRWRWSRLTQQGAGDRRIGPSDPIGSKEVAFSWLPGIHVRDTHDREEGS
jgi:hypothetical protein